MVKKLYTVTDAVAGFIASVPGYPTHSLSYSQRMRMYPSYVSIVHMLKTQSDEIASLRSTVTEMQDTITTLKRKIDCSASTDSNSDGDGSRSPNENDLAILKSSISLLESKISDLENQLKVQSKENLASKISDLENQLKVLPEAKPAKNKSINDDNMNSSHASVPINVDSNNQVTTVINSFLNEGKATLKSNYP